jgi:hypothetical protein
MSVTINASTSSGLIQSSDTSGTVEIQSNGTTKLTVASTGAYGQLVSGTAVPYTSFTTTTYNDFTGIPSWVKRITVMLQGVSTSGTSAYLVQIGSSGTPVTTGYVGNVAGVNGATTASATLSTGFNLNRSPAAARTYQGNIVITNITGNTWTAAWNIADDTTVTNFGAGVLALSGVLNIVRLTTVGSPATDTFDAGSINILYEG